MYCFQTGAASVPPNASGPIATLPVGLPTQTAVEYCGVYPTNHVPPLFDVVPVLPAD